MDENNHRENRKLQSSENIDLSEQVGLNLYLHSRVTFDLLAVSVRVSVPPYLSTGRGACSSRRYTESCRGLFHTLTDTHTEACVCECVCALLLCFTHRCFCKHDEAEGHVMKSCRYCALN